MYHITVLSAPLQQNECYDLANVAAGIMMMMMMMLLLLYEKAIFFEDEIY